MTVLVLLLVLVVVAAAVAFWALGIRNDWAAWPFVVGWGFAVLAALFMSAVGLCDDAAGTCPEQDRIDRYQGALPALILLVVAAALLVIRNDAVRRIGFPVLTAIGMILVALRLLDDGLRFIPIVLFALVALGILVEALDRARLRADARTNAG